MSRGWRFRISGKRITTESTMSGFCDCYSARGGKSRSVEGVGYRMIPSFQQAVMRLLNVSFLNIVFMVLEQQPCD